MDGGWRDSDGLTPDKAFTKKIYWNQRNIVNLLMLKVEMSKRTLTKGKSSIMNFK